MRCLEVSVNGNLKSVAGIADADSIEARVLTCPQLDESRLIVTGSVDIDGQPSADAVWLSMPIAVGDLVGIRLIDEPSPTLPELRRYDAASGATDGLPVCCAFCGKSNSQVEGGMLASEKAFICRKCVLCMHDLVINEPKG